MKQGFTLIELLVVVLIIGILSAVALPQYTAAVEKARASEVVSLMASAEKGADLYVMEYGYPSGTVELVGPRGNVQSGSMTIDLESSLDCTTTADYCESKNFRYDVYCSGTTCYWRAQQKKTPAQYSMSGSRPRRGQWTRRCSYTTKEGRVICEGLRAQGWEVSGSVR